MRVSSMAVPWLSLFEIERVDINFGVMHLGDGRGEGDV